MALPREKEQVLSELDLLSHDYIFSKIQHLLLELDNIQHQYRAAKPYPHIVLDDFFPVDVLDKVLAEFPDKQSFGRKFNNPQEIKYATRHENEIPLFTRHFLYSLNSQTFLTFVENITGISHLISDPGFEGGGLHQILPGGKLSIHADFNIHSKYALDRRLNILIYLNKHWKEEYGGHFELWTKDMKQCAKKVAPVFNRVVIFSTTSETYHGHPDPLACPDNMSRKSLALYYYSNGRPENEVQARHSTQFKTRPNEIFALNNKQKALKLLPRRVRKYFN